MYHLKINYWLKIIYDMVIAIDAGKALDQFNSQLVTKVLSELEIKSNFLNMQRVSTENPADGVLPSEKVQVFSLRPKTVQRHAL